MKPVVTILFGPTAHPASRFVQAGGNFYGTTPSGGANNAGTIFTFKSGSLTFLHSFCLQQGCADGNSPNGLIQDTNGAFYGTTAQGGSGNHGTVFSLSLGLKPFVKTLPIAAAVGTPVTIIGTNLDGATSVTFNGVSASYTADSQSRLTATVPSGATTGPVEVVTPQRTLYSDRLFQVLP